MLSSASSSVTSAEPFSTSPHAAGIENASSSSAPPAGYRLPAFRAAKPPRFVDTSSPKRMKDKLTRRGSMHHFGRSELKVDLVLPPRQHHSQRPGTSGSELIRHREHRQQNMPPSPNANHLQSGSNLHGSNLLDEGSRLATDDVTDDVAADIASLSKTYANDTTNQHLPPALQHTLNSAFGMHRFGYTTTGTSPADTALEKNALVRHRHRLVTKKRTSSKSLIQGPLGGRKVPKKLTRRRSVVAGSTKNPDGNNSIDSQTDLSQGSNMLGRRSLRRRARSMGDLTSVTVDGLVEELNEFYSDALRNPLPETTDEAVSTPSPLEVADILRRESVRFHPAIVSNIRLLWNTSRRQYGKGFGFGQYVIICRKLLMAVVGGDAFKSIGRRDVFDQLVEDWKIDSGSKQNFLTFEQFWKAMYQMIDTWAPGLGSEVRIEWFDKIASKILYQDAAGTTFFVEDDAVNDSAQRARLEKNTHKSQLRHATASATSEHGRIQPRRMSLHHGHFATPIERSPIHAVDAADMTSSVSTATISHEPETIATPIVKVAAGIHVPPTSAFSRESAPPRHTVGTAGSVLSASSTKSTVRAAIDSASGRKSRPASSVKAKLVPNMGIQPPADSRATSAARAWTRESTRSRNIYNNEHKGNEKSVLEGSPRSSSSVSTGFRQEMLPQASSTEITNSRNQPQLKTSPTQPQCRMHQESEENGRMNGRILGATRFPELAEGSGQGRIFPCGSVDLDYMEPTMIDSRVSQPSVISRGGYLADTVDIRSCVLLAHPQPFRTWDGHHVSAPRDTVSISAWLKKFEDRSQHSLTKSDEIDTSNVTGSPNGTGNMSIRMGGDSNIKTEANHSDPISSSRDFRFQTSRGKATRFARVTKDRLRVHTRHCRKDQGFSLWMRGDLAPYFKDRSECNRKRLSTKAGDIKILTQKRHVKLDEPKRVLMQAHRAVNDNIAADVELASRLERGNGRWWWSGNGRRYGVSKILNQSVAKLATQPPRKPWPIAQPMENRLYLDAGKSYPPPVINSKSGFSPICIIHSAQEPEKYWRRKLLPLNVQNPPARLVAGANMDSSIMMRGGQDAVEARAVQGALDCAERVKAERIRKMRAASRGGW